MTAVTVGASPRANGTLLRPVLFIWRISSALTMLGLATAGIIYNGVYRAAEATGAADAMGYLLSGRAVAVGDVFWVYPDGFTQGFRVTAECTAILLIAPLLALAAVLVLFTKAPAGRVWLGVAVMYVIVTVVNEARLVIIACSSVQWGMKNGYEIAHVLIGSFIGILGFAAGLIALILISVGRRSSPRRKAIATA